MSAIYVVAHTCSLLPRKPLWRCVFPLRPESLYLLDQYVTVALHSRRVLGAHFNMMDVEMSPLLMIKLTLGNFFPSLIFGDEVDFKTFPLPTWSRFSFLLQESGYMHLQGTKPDTIGRTWSPEVSRLFSALFSGRGFLALDGFTDYLKDRNHMEEAEHCSSEKHWVKRGIPRGTVFGPVLFNVYVNDIMRVPLNNKRLRFGDDTVMVYAQICYNIATLKFKTALTK